MTPADLISHTIRAETWRKGSSRRTVAALYSVAIGTGRDDVGYWRPINEAVVDRFGYDGLRAIKTTAWRIHDAAAAALKAVVDQC